MHFLAVDTETGGLDPSYSLLTAYMAIVDADFNVIDELNLKLKPDNGIFNCSEEALKINGINLEEHSKASITYSEAAPMFDAFVKKHSQNQKLMILGQNVDFDIRFLQKYLMPEKEFSKAFDREKLDLMEIVAMLQVIKIVPRALARNLSQLSEFFGVKYINAHEAKADIKITLRVVQKMFKSLKSGRAELS